LRLPLPSATADTSPLTGLASLGLGACVAAAGPVQLGGGAYRAAQTRALRGT
jgi:hypothetical protein